MERRHRMQPFLGGELAGKHQGLLKLAPVLDKFRAERPHRVVLLGIVAMRHHDHGPQSVQLRGKRDRLPVIPRGRSDHTAHAGFGAFQLVHVNEPAANLEGTHRRVVLVLQPQFAAEFVFEQRPATGRRFANVRTNERLRRFDLAEGWQRNFGEGLHRSFPHQLLHCRLNRLRPDAVALFIRVQEIGHDVLRDESFGCEKF